MFRAKPILGFLCRFVVVFGLLVAPWPGWKDLYARVLRQTASAVLGAYGSNGIESTLNVPNHQSLTVDFGSFGSGVIVGFARNPAGDKTLDTVVYLANRERALANDDWTGKTCAFSSRFLAYLPTALVVALILATEINWRRRLFALLWGLLLVHLFISFQLWLIIAVKLCANPELGGFAFSTFSCSIISALYQCFVEHIGTNLATAVPIWILVTFRHGDWTRLLHRHPAAGEVKP